MDKIKFDYNLSIIEELVNNNKYYDAIDKIKELFDKIDTSNIGNSFNNGIEYYLYLVKFDKKIIKQNLNYKKLYDLYGTSLMLIGKYIEAREMFKKSLEINPFDSLTRFKYTDTFRLTNELDEFFKSSNDAINYCYKAIDFQRFYRNLSEYYFRYENYVEALYMMLFARYVYEENLDITNPELFRIYDCLGKRLDPSIDAILNFMQNKNINSPSLVIQELNYIYAKIKDNDAVTSFEILEALYELTNDSEYKKLIDDFNNILNK